MPTRARALLFGVALFVVTASARADEPNAAPSTDARRDAATRFEEGTRAFDAGDYRRAGDLFELAYKLAPHEDPLWNAARAWQRAGEIARAANLFARYLRVAPADARDRGKATQAMAQLAQRLARIEVQLGRGVDSPRVDGQPIEDASVYVVPGSHIVRARSANGDVEAEKSAQAGETVSVVLSASAREEPRAMANVTTPAPSAEPRSGFSPLVVVFGSAVTGALAGLTAWSGFETMGTLHDFDAAPTQDKLDRGRSQQTRTNVLLGVSLGAAALTGVTAIFLTDWSGKRAARTALGLTPSGVTLGGAFE